MANSLPALPQAPCGIWCSLGRLRKFVSEKAMSADEGEAEWKAIALQATLCGLALVVGYAVGQVAPGHPVSLACYMLSVIAGSWEAVQEAWAKLRLGQLDIHFLMLLVAAGAASIGAWEEGALLLFLFSTSGALEHYVLHRTHREISSLTQNAPKMAHRLGAEETVEDVAVEVLAVGDRLLVKPDELFAVDATVTEGETAADESTLTGEALPITKRPGAKVYSGTLNLWGIVKVTVDRPVQESSLQKIIKLIHEAQQSRAPSQRFTDKFGTGYTLGVLACVTGMFFVWWLALGLPPFASTVDAKSAFYRAMTLLVVMSPCALVLSIPSAILAAIAWGAKRGILFRGGAAIERLAEIDTVAMDKTGTLTKGELRVAAVESFPAGQETAVLQLAFGLEQSSNHPLARAIVFHGKQQGLEPLPVNDFQSIAGQGLRASTSNGPCWLGRRELIASTGDNGVLVEVADAALGFTEVWVRQGNMLGRLLLQDEVREQSRPVLKAMVERGLKTLMLTGDRPAAAEQIAAELGLSEVRAGLHPEDKVAAIHELTAQGHRVAMVGDGVNDAPSLAAAHVSLAMGARGSDAALEQADVILMQDKIEKMLSALTISQRAKTIIRQNIAISLGAVILMATASILGQIPLTLSVLAHEGSTVVVCLNSLRLLFVKEPLSGRA